jgi:hypothetical protein
LTLCILFATCLYITTTAVVIQTISFPLCIIGLRTGPLVDLRSERPFNLPSDSVNIPFYRPDPTTEHTVVIAIMPGLVSAAGLVGFLSEPEPELRSFALKQLDEHVDLLWTEIANHVGEM